MAWPSACSDIILYYEVAHCGLLHWFCLKEFDRFSLLCRPNKNKNAYSRFALLLVNSHVHIKIIILKNSTKRFWAIADDLQANYLAYSG